MATCSVCGAETSGAFCEYCGSPMNTQQSVTNQAKAVETAPNTAAYQAAAQVAPSQMPVAEQARQSAAPSKKSEPVQQGYDPEIEQTMDVTDKKCPNCGGTVVFDPESGMMSCEYCGYKKELPNPEDGREVEEMDFNSATERSSCDWGAEKKTVICKQCGGEAVYDSVETAACCPFCGSTSVMPVEGIENVMAPGGVVPFAISKEKAAELFKKWLGGKFFAPKAAKQSCSAKEINGIYLPYWTYDTDTTSPYTARLGYDRTVTDKDGNKKTVTDWRNTRGVYQEFIDDQLVYASKKTTNPYIKRVSDFDFEKLRPYTPEIVAGFVAERYTVGLDEGWGIAKPEIQKTIKANLLSKLKKQYRCDRVEGLRFSTQYDNIKFKYLLAPIWLAAYKFNGKTFNIVINGQTGKVAGKSPVSKLKVGITIGVVIAILIIIGIIATYA